MYMPKSVGQIAMAIMLVWGSAGWMITATRSDAMPVSSEAADAPAPRLVIEAGGHQAIIRELLFTADGSELISVSDDKTIRIWSVSADGRQADLTQTIRGQIGDGRAGMLAAAALSPPDAEGQQRWLAVGGFLAGAPADRDAIRLHDYATGEVQALFYGHNASVLALAFSPDGRWLASASKDNTLRLWDLTLLQGERLEPAAQILTGHTDDVYDLAWSPTGERLVSASYDRTVGLWDTAALPEGQVRLVAQLEGHTEPVRSVAFHPDGSVFASGSKDQTIRLWRAEDGDALGVFAKASHKVSALAFSPDGDLLLAGNDAPPKPKALTLYTYPQGKTQQVFTGHHNTVLATAFHPSGQWVASGGGDEKEVMLWDVNTGEILSRLEGVGRTIWSVGFSDDGRYLSWGQTSHYTSSNDRGPLEHRFDLKELTRVPEGLRRDQAVRAQVRVGDRNLVVERGGPYGYDYRLHVRHRRKVLGTIERDNTDGYLHSAYSLTPDGQHVLSGGFNGELWLYTADGRKRAKLVGHTGEIKAVAISADGKWALSGAVDQTLRLWPLADLSEPDPEDDHVELLPALSLFPATDGEWIAWTPEGYFTASENGAYLIGYSVNQGLGRTAKYVAADQLYDRFYRPDLLHARLHGDPQKLWQQEGAFGDVERVLSGGLPPQVRFVTPSMGATVAEPKTQVRVAIAGQGGGIGKVVWKIDGVTVAVDTAPKGNTLRRLPPQRQDVTISQALQLTPGENIVEVTAYNRQNNVASPPVRLTIMLQAPSSLPIAKLPQPAPITPPPGVPPSPAPVTPPGLRPDLHLFIVGIDSYRDKDLWLNYAVSDGRSFSSALRDVAAPLFREVAVTELYDDLVTLSNLDHAFREVSATIRPHDVFVVYFAGHGITLDGQYYFLPQDLLYENDDAVRRHGINQDHLQSWLARISARRSLVLLDTCESGSFVDAFASTRSMVEKTAAAKLTRATGRATIVAATDNQPAVEGYKGYGVFTYVLLQALRHADTSVVGNHDGYTGLFELAAYVNNRVPEIAMQEFGFQQTPQIHTLGADFPLAIAQANSK